MALTMKSCKWEQDWSVAHPTQQLRDVRGDVATNPQSREQTTVRQTDGRKDWEKGRGGRRRKRDVMKEE